MRKTILAAIAVFSVTACGSVVPESGTGSQRAVFSSDDASAHRASWGSANVPVARGTYFSTYSCLSGGGG